MPEGELAPQLLTVEADRLAVNPYRLSETNEFSPPVAENIQLILLGCQMMESWSNSRDGIFPQSLALTPQIKQQVEQYEREVSELNTLRSSAFQLLEMSRAFLQLEETGALDDDVRAEVTKKADTFLSKDARNQWNMLEIEDQLASVNEAVRSGYLKKLIGIGSKVTPLTRDALLPGIVVSDLQLFEEKLQIVAHDYGAPIQEIIGYGQMFADEGNRYKVARQYLEQVNSGVLNLRGASENAKYILAAEPKTLEVSAMATQFAAKLESFAKQIPGVNFQASISIPEGFSFHMQYSEELINSLISNYYTNWHRALQTRREKFPERSGEPIEISCTVEVDMKGRVRFIVTDNIIGYPPSIATRRKFRKGATEWGDSVKGNSGFAMHGHAEVASILHGSLKPENQTYTMEVDGKEEERLLAVTTLDLPATVGIKGHTSF